MTFLNACRNGQKSIVQIFLKKGGIDVNKRDAEGNTPLYYACLKGLRDIVGLLLDSDADVSIANNCSETPLHAAASERLLSRRRIRGVHPSLSVASKSAPYCTSFPIISLFPLLAAAC